MRFYSPLACAAFRGLKSSISSIHNSKGMTMRKLAICLALAGTALAGPALAKDKSWYIGIEAGPNLMQNQGYDIANAAGTTRVKDGITQNYAVGYDVGGNIGYDFGPFRAEFALNYNRNNVRNTTIEQGIPAINYSAAVNGPSILGAPPLGVNSNAGGNVEALSFMVNGLADFGGQDGEWGGYLGAGAGIARVTQGQQALNAPGAVFLNDSDTSFAWQVLAGVYKPINDHIDIGLKYRFFSVPQVDTFTTNGLSVNSRYRSHSLLLT
ncbi:outer membrane beta-barrel protein, partial [Sandarakinorhabdus sp.]|uniref:outer membrane protein n=1 Tax=Sandarakinorhabdus sp. TaxID=1916663 RepID=UPI00286E84F0